MWIKFDELIMNEIWLTNIQRKLAIQRLTALWAFAESGLGGVLHTLKAPFTGLIVGGFAIILIIFIAKISDKKYEILFKSLIIVLIVKLTVSPVTPITAYIAVSFQASLGYVLFKLFNINFISIFLLSTIAMLESAIQKLIVLILFFGESFWKANDVLNNFILTQFNFAENFNKNWIISIYLLIYLLVGILISFMTHSILKNISNPKFCCDFKLEESFVKQSGNTKNKWMLILCFYVVIIFLLMISFDKSLKLFSIIKLLTWSIFIIVIWFLIVTPLLTNLLLSLLEKKKTKYRVEVNEILNLIPHLNSITKNAWLQSSSSKGFQRITHFISLLLIWSITFSAET